MKFCSALRFHSVATESHLSFLPTDGQSDSHPSAILLALLCLTILLLLRLVLPHSDDHVCDQHNVGHNGRRSTGKGGVACAIPVNEAATEPFR